MDNSNHQPWNLASLLQGRGEEATGASLSSSHFLNGGEESPSKNSLGYSEKGLSPLIVVLSHQLTTGAAVRHSTSQLHKKLFARK